MLKIMSKNILGLDLGTNSIGWALVKQDFKNKEGEILGMGSRIIPMSQDIIGDFGKGNSISQTADRTAYRGVRRLRERHLLRRERLHRVLHILNFLPKHYDQQIDFIQRLGKFKRDFEPKIAYFENEFLFKESFNEMLEDFKVHQPGFLLNKKGENSLVPYDWTIYYLRKKALTQKIEKEELSWIILNFNQKRGYYQLRGEEEEESPNKLVEFHSLRIVDVVADEQKNNKGEFWYSLQLENGWVYRRSSKIPLDDWKNKVRDFIVSTDLNDDGTEKIGKDGNVKRSFRAPSPDDWTLMKKKTEQEIKESDKTVGTFIYDHLLAHPKQKIKGQLVRTIERKFYKEELHKILSKQAEFHNEFKDSSVLNNCACELYRSNHLHQKMIASKDLLYLFINDIIFYQRPLRSQKSNIGTCSLEFRVSKDEKGQEIVRPLKVIAKSNPYYQEFRLRQWIQNLSIYRKNDDVNVTRDFWDSIEDLQKLFEFLNQRKEIEQKFLIKFLLENQDFKGKALTAEIEKYRWNYVQDKKYHCNETRHMIQSRLDKVRSTSDGFLTFEKEMALWHLIYSVTDKIEYEKALKTFSKKNGLEMETFVDAFKKIPPFNSDYGSYSEKAIKNLLPLLRFGKTWSWESINTDAQSRIDKIITGEFDENIKTQIREKAEKYKLNKEKDFQNLPLWLAQYIMYGRHSEAALAGKWTSVKDLEDFVKDFKQHSLRNPIVEQIITETLRVVQDIWKKYGKGAANFFDEIHVELGRDMKNTADERKSITNIVTENENTNLRIKLLLAEMSSDIAVDNVRAYSPMQAEILKIYEDGILKSDIEIEEDILKISKTAQPSSSELRRYKLWLEQKYKSPYTGQIIPLNKLFTSEYEIEHIIPQSRYFDDSFSNKVICESAVNKLKDNQIGLEFIKNFHGYKMPNGTKIFEIDEYENFVKLHYNKNRSKRNKLLMDDIPEKMIERQLNDTRYISKYISNLLSNIVRSDVNDDGYNSKNILPGNGKITNRLKQDWGLNDVWNDLVLPRFERMNQITNSSDFTSYNENHQKFLPTVPLKLSKGFSKKRIDHRHHAMDALVIACATRDHINLLNNESAKSDSKRYDLNRKLRKFEKVAYNDSRTGERIEREVAKDFLKPWGTFTNDAKKELGNIVISFKQNLRVINKATNYYEKWVDKNGELTKENVKQEGVNWAIRKPLHKETVSGKIKLDRIKVAKGKILTATRKMLDTSFNEKVIATITDTGIQKILLNYLRHKGGNSEIAFSPEGVEEMNLNISHFNDGKDHQPILKVRVFEQGSKFILGETGNKTDKYVEAAKGTNLFFAVYADNNGKRNFQTIPLNLVVERQKQGLNSVPEENDKGEKLLFTLSPNDLVCLSEIESFKEQDLYKVVSFSGSQLFFIKHNMAVSIVNKIEFSALNKMERSIDGIMIKDICVKLEVDRLGNISKA
jgi:CRISPR-associated endonuclease Csn1